MASNFWQQQSKARGRTALYITFFVILTFAIALLLEYVVRQLAVEGYTPPMPYLGILFLAITFFVSGIYYLIYVKQGGKFVAEALGARKVLPSTADFKEQQLLNIVQEMAIASGLPTPAVYVLEAKEINAFAAGVKPDNAVITVTRGSLELLNRDELQGVVAHEFGHIYNFDMKINMRLAAMLMGFFFIFIIGLRLLEGSLFFGRDRRGGNPIALAALLFFLAGLVTWFAGAILRSMVSRQREYLADAMAVQFTRNPDGIANALRKISKTQAIRDMPSKGMGYSHLYFENHSFWSALFATHPPIEKRIAAIEGKRIHT